MHSLLPVVLEKRETFQSAVFEGLEGSPPQDDLLTFPLLFLLVAGTLLLHCHTAAAVVVRGGVISVCHRLAAAVQVSIVCDVVIIVLIGVALFCGRILLLGHSVVGGGH